MTKPTAMCSALEEDVLAEMGSLWNVCRGWIVVFVAFGVLQV